MTSIFWCKQMLNKILAASPVTQSREAVKQLIAYQTHGQEPAEMPPFYRLGAEMVLVQSNKKDVYYVTTPKACSCPAAAYHPGQTCEHSRKYFPQPKTEAAEEGSIRPECKWAGNMNGSVDPSEIKVVA